jgi:hypothetical protein
LFTGGFFAGGENRTQPLLKKTSRVALPLD